MSANNSSLKGVLGSKYQTVGKTEDPKPAEDPSQRRRVSGTILYLFVCSEVTPEPFGQMKRYHVHFTLCQCHNRHLCTTISNELSLKSSSAAKFNSLMNQKRNSTDATAEARKASFAEQSKAPGVFGGLWQRSDTMVTQEWIRLC